MDMQLWECLGKGTLANFNPDQPERVKGLGDVCCMCLCACLVCADRDTGLSPVLICSVLCMHLFLQSTCPALLQPVPGMGTIRGHVWQTGRRNSLSLTALKI